MRRVTRHASRHGSRKHEHKSSSWIGGLCVPDDPPAWNLVTRLESNAKAPAAPGRPHPATRSLSDGRQNPAGRRPPKLPRQSPRTRPSAARPRELPGRWKKPKRRKRNESPSLSFASPTPARSNLDQTAPEASAIKLT